MFFVRLSIAWLFSMNNKTNLSEFAGVFFIKFLCKQLDFIKITLRSLVLIQYFECVLFTDCCYCFFWCRGGSFFLPFFLFSVKCTLVSCLSHVCVCLHVMRVYLLASVYVLLECVTLMHKVSRSACYFVVPNIILFVWFSFFFLLLFDCSRIYLFISFSSFIIFFFRLWRVVRFLSCIFFSSSSVVAFLCL